jgi:hypothetical protein
VKENVDSAYTRGSTEEDRKFKQLHLVLQHGKIQEPERRSKGVAGAGTLRITNDGEKVK